MAATINPAEAVNWILALADGSDVQKADKNFLESLGRDGYAASQQAKAAEDLLQCFKVPNDEAFDDAVASPALQSLDHAVAQVAKALSRPVVSVESAAPAVAPAPGVPASDDSRTSRLDFGARGKRFTEFRGAAAELSARRRPWGAAIRAAASQALPEAQGIAAVVAPVVAPVPVRGPEQPGGA